MAHKNSPLDPVFLPISKALRALPEISRRTFLGGASAVITSAAMAESRSNIIASSLQFSWIGEPGKVLRIEEFADKGDATESTSSLEAVWDVALAAFGPSATAYLSEQPEGGRTLHIRNAGFGRSTGREIDFVFEQGKDFAYRLFARTNLWSLSRNATHTEAFHLGAIAANAPIERGVEPVAFREFADGRAGLSQWVANGRVTSTFKLIFNGVVYADSRSGDNQIGVFLSVDRDLVWKVDTSKRRAGEVWLGALNDDIRVSDFTFAWCLPPEARRTTSGALRDELCEGGEDATGTSVVARGTARVPRRLTFGMAEGEIALRIDGTDEQASQDETVKTLFVTTGMRVQEGVIGIGSHRVEAHLVVEGALMQRSGQGATQFGPVCKLTGRLRSRVDAPASADNIDHAANAYVVLEAGFSRSVPQSIATPAGSFVVSGRPEETEGKAPGAPSQAGGDRNPAGGDGDQPGGNGEARRDGDQPGGDGDQAAGGAEAERQSFSYGSPVRLALKREDRRFRLTWMEIHMALHECRAQLAGSDRSALTFGAHGSIVFHGGSDAGPVADGSWVRLDRPVDAPWSRLDLGGALLTVGRHADLVSLQFRFRDLALEVSASGALHIVPSGLACSVGVDTPPLREEGPGQIATAAAAASIRDRRPILTVEFPSLHVTEEALFRPTPPPPPDVELAGLKLKLVGEVATFEELAQDDVLPMAEGEAFYVRPTSPAQLAQALGCLASSESRRKIREAIRDKKIDVEQQKEGAPSFRTFAKKYCERVKKAPLPDDQKIYIGPYLLAPDAMQIMRALRDEGFEAQAGGLIDAFFQEAKAAAAKLETVDGYDDTFAGRLRLEQAVAGTVPAYAQFRAFYRETMIDAYLKSGSIDKGTAGQLKAESLTAETLEFFLARNRQWAQGAEGLLGVRETQVRRLYKTAILGRDPVPSLMEGRLARPSRLSFRLGCFEPLAARRLQTGIFTEQEDEAEQIGRQALDYSLDALLDWSNMEMSVIDRAKVLFKPDERGRAGVRSSRRIDTDGDAMLDMLGFPSGEDLGTDTWMAHIETIMRRAPGAHETAIRIGRIDYSPSQLGQFLTPREPDSRIFRDLPPDVARRIATPDWFVPATPLWSARLVTHRDGGDPGLRAVWSPSLWPDFVHERRRRDGLTLARLEGGEPGVETTRLPGGAPPPRGPIAPWLVGRDDVMPGDVTPERIAKQFLENSTIPPENHAEILKDNGTCYRGKPLPALVEFLCRRRKAKEENEALRAASKFRGATDASIEHEVTLLSSAYGLPIKSAASPQGSPELFVPARRHRLLDAHPDAAIYIPKVLGVDEMVLTTLGASIRLDTSFRPPVALEDINGTPLYRTFSIERFKRWTVLGRDTHVEVVFKGYLLPCCHSCSLVQITERTFLLDPAGHVKAYLTQRLFIRRGRENVDYPALGQPNEGRSVPFARATLKTEESPDLVDPYSGVATNAAEVEGIQPKDIQPKYLQPTAAGRLVHRRIVGLVFLPRTALSPSANVPFELECDEHPITMPLLFVDNAAANDPETMAAVTEWYNAQPDPLTTGSMLDRSRHIRSALLGGRPVTYAPEAKRGSTTVETEAWTFAVEGMQARAPKQALGEISDKTATVVDVSFENTSFDFNAALQASGQPPFYPALETARLRLRQNERLTGQIQKAVLARYDGVYVRNGLPIPSAEAEPEAISLADDRDRGNAMEIFLVLDLLDPPTQEMGNRGDNSGGVVRPATRLVGLSRTRGPVGLDSDIKICWRTDRDGCHKPPADAPGTRALPALAPLFDFSLSQPAANGVVDTTTPSTANAAQSSSDTIRRIYKQYCSPDFKLLGLVPIKKIFAVISDEVSFEPPDTGLPELLESVRYGIGSAAEEGAEDVTEQIRRQVVRPLLEVVTEIQEEWRELDAAIIEGQPTLPGAEPLGFNELFPELDAGLSGLRASLIAALAISDPLEFALQLGEVYSAGHRLLDAMRRSAAELPNRFELAVQERISSLDFLFNTFTQGLDEVARLLPATIFLALTGRPLPERPEQARQILAHGLANLIVFGKFSVAETSSDLPAGARPDDPAFWTPIALPLLRLEGLTPEQQAVLQQAAEALKPRRAQMKTLVFAVLHALLSGKSLEAVLKEPILDGGSKTVAAFITDVMAERRDAALKIITDSAAFSQASALVARIEERLDLFVFHLKSALAQKRDELLAVGRRRLAAELAGLSVLAGELRPVVERLQQVRQHVDGGRQALANGRWGTAAGHAVQLVEVFAGPTNLGTVIDEAWKRPIQAVNLLVDLEGLQLCGLAADAIGENPGICTLAVVDGRIVIDEKFKPKTTASEPVAADAACGALWEVHEGLEAALANGGAVDDIAEAIDDSSLPTAEKASLAAEHDKLKGQLGIVHRAIAETYCDLFNDSRALRVFSQDWAVLAGGDAIAGADALPGVVRQARALFASRRMFFTRLAARLKEIARQTDLLLAAGLAGALKAAYDATGDARIEEALETLEQTVDGYAELLAEYLLPATQGLEKLLVRVVNFANEVNAQLAELDSALAVGGETIALLTAHARYLKEISEKLDGVETADDLREIAAKLGNGPDLSLIAWLQALENDAEAAGGAGALWLQARVEAVADALADRLAGLAVEVQQEVLQGLDEVARKIVRLELPTMGPLRKVYADILDLRNKAISKPGVADAVRERLLVEVQAARKEIKEVTITIDGTPFTVSFKPSAGALEPAGDRLAGDVAWLRLISGDSSAPVSNEDQRRFLLTFLREFEAGDATPMLIGKQIFDLAREVVRSVVTLNLDAVRDRIEDELLKLVPTQIVLSYDFGLPLASEIKDITGGIFRPGKGCRLDIGLNVVIDLLDGNGNPNPSINVRSSGGLGPFEIKLVGSFDALTLKFDGLRFESRGAEPEFDVAYRDYEIGKQLAFVQDLQSYLSPKPGSGAYVTPLVGRPGIEAGYSLDLGSLSIGNLSFFNVSLNTSALLPFSDDGTRFRASLSRRDSPFTISYAPYGGSGFFAIEADATGIVAFEASFEFGGAGAFGFGPLQGQGRIMAGFYIRQFKAEERTLTELMGTFYVGGSAAIWIFHFAASLSVRLGMDANGAMIGEATFSFSFSVGFADYSYSVTMRKNEGRGFQGEQTALASGTRFAGLSAALPAAAGSDGPRIERDVACQGEDWNRYRSYFDRSLDWERVLDV